ncbi:MAG TPA: right-handed parallel beta-helix repeat-containing protein [Candidatus Sulfomarinibacteraceae bacterium]|nr:right-handed parallel beta-helix repeat-containing protein [Candidatus Sulfomarinibacteraceae bacterium]
MRELLRPPSLRRCRLAVLFLAASPAWSQIAVDQNDPSCSDATGSPYCTLASAIAGAVSGDTILVAAGTYPLANYDLFNKDLKIVGAGRALTTLDGQSTSRLFMVSLGVRLELVDLTLRNGSAVDTGGCIDVYASTLVLRSCRVTDCDAGTSGGAIHASGESTVELVMTEIAGNTAASGGGVSVSSPGILRVDNCSVTGNLATSSGGGLMASGALELSNVTVAWNRAYDHGGGMYISSPASGVLANLTVADNQADSDDGVASVGGLGGGVRFDGAPAVEVRNSIIADNTVGASGSSPDCSGTLVSGGYNLISSTAGCTVTGDGTGNLVAVNSYLLPLVYQGGPTPTMALDSGSYAIDAGNPAGCLDASGGLRLTDQRGFPSPEEGGDGVPGVACDIGAYEVSSCFFADGFESSTTSGWSFVN